MSNDRLPLVYAVNPRAIFRRLYKVNEYAHKLEKQKLKDAIIRVTGADKNSSTVKAIAGTFESLKKYADFEKKSLDVSEDVLDTDEPIAIEKTTSLQQSNGLPNSTTAQARGMNLSYTINLNLPASKDPEVFDAIFKSLKQNLLS